MPKSIPNCPETVKKPLRLRTAKRKEHFLFNLLCFLYFRRSAARSIEVPPIGTLIIIPYVFFAEVYFFQSRRYFVTIGEQILGLFAIQEKTDAIFISVLASHPFYRRTGIASFVLNHVVIFAKKLGKTSVELAVTKRNKPALKLYNKFGFHVKKEKRRSYVLQYQF